MKKTSEVTLLLISLFINIIVSFFLGYKYKSQLIAYFSDAIYYQIIIFISLTLPVIVKKIDTMQHNWHFQRGLNELKKNAHKIDKNSIGESEREMLEEMTNTDMQTASKIRDLYGELKRKSES